MSTARVEPLGVDIEVLDGETLMGAALRSGYRWPTVCGGEGWCTTCVVRVTEGADALDAPSPWEAQALAKLPQPGPGQPPFRLACQMRPRGRLVVNKPGVRPAS